MKYSKHRVRHSYAKFKGNVEKNTSRIAVTGQLSTFAKVFNTCNVGRVLGLRQFAPITMKESQVLVLPWGREFCQN